MGGEGGEKGGEEEGREEKGRKRGEGGKGKAEKEVSCTHLK